MTNSAGELLRIATEARQDFEAGKITGEMVLGLMRIYQPSYASSWEGVMAREGEPFEFPTGKCIAASVVLLDRIGSGVIHHGGYDTGESLSEVEIATSGYRDAPSTVIEPHAFWASQPLSEADDNREVIIADITADQFQYGEAVYVGAFGGSRLIRCSTEIWE